MFARLSLALSATNIKYMNGHLPHILFSLQAFFCLLCTKLLNREADEVECQSRLHATGPDSGRKKSSFSLLFSPPFPPLDRQKLM